MKLEAVGGISVGDLSIQVGGQVDDSNSINCSYQLIPMTPIFICIDLHGHFLGQIPHPIQRLSDIKASLESGATSIHSFPLRTTGQL